MTQNKPIKVGKGVEKRKDAGALPAKVYNLSNFEVDFHVIMHCHCLHVVYVIFLLDIF